MRFQAYSPFPRLFLLAKSWGWFFTCLSHSNVGSKDLLEVWCGSNRLVLHPSPDKTFSQILTQKICQGPSMDSTLGTASRHHDKNLQCDYFDAKCCQRSLKRFEKVLHKKNKSKSSKLYSMFAILQCHALKVLWWSHSLKNFMPPLLLESWFKTEAGGGICSDVVRVSPLFQHYHPSFKRAL